MQIKDVKDLRKIIQLCRQTGVYKIKVDNVELELGSEPYKQPRTPSLQEQTINPWAMNYSPGVNVSTDDVKIPSFDDLTEEQKLFYSVNEGT